MTVPETVAPDRRAARRAVLSGAVGTAVEYYDFFIYGTAAALVLNRLFFPDISPVLGTLAAFATFAVGFAVRPLGSIIFGYVGDKFGRKKALVFSLLLMGIATLAIGFLPTFDQVGILAPILLVLCRLLQGAALGGEWGGATVLAAEYAPPGKRGLIGSFVQTGSPIGLLLSSGVFALVGLLPDDQFVSYGWRIPFWASALLVMVGLYIRLNILESPEFLRARAAGEVAEKAPAIEVFRYSWRALLVAIGARLAPDIGFYIAGTFIVGYAVNNIGYTQGQILTGVIIAAAIEIITIPLFGALSDRIGRRKIYFIGTAWWAIMAFPLFALVNTGTPELAWLGIALALSIGHSMLWSVGASLNSELFPTRYRTTGASFGLNIGNIVGGGPAALIAGALVLAASGSSWLVSLYILIAAVLSFIAMLFSQETSKRDLSKDYSTREVPVITRAERLKART